MSHTIQPTILARMFALSISFGREPAQAPGGLWNPLVLLHLLQQLEPDEADMVCRTADPINRSRREHNWSGMPVMPDEVEWIIPPGAADPTSGSLREGDMIDGSHGGGWDGPGCHTCRAKRTRATEAKTQTPLRLRRSVPIWGINPPRRVW